MVLATPPSKACSDVPSLYMFHMVYVAGLVRFHRWVQGLGLVYACRLFTLPELYVKVDNALDWQEFLGQPTTSIKVVTWTAAIV